MSLIVPHIVLWGEVRYISFLGSCITVLFILLKQWGVKLYICSCNSLVSSEDSLIQLIMSFLIICLFVVCRSHSNTGDYGGDNFDAGQREEYSFSSDLDVSFVSMSHFICKRYAVLFLIGLSYHLFFLFF